MAKRIAGDPGRCEIAIQDMHTTRIVLCFQLYLESQVAIRFTVDNETGKANANNLTEKCVENLLKEILAGADIERLIECKVVCQMDPKVFCRGLEKYLIACFTNNKQKS